MTDSSNDICHWFTSVTKLLYKNQQLGIENHLIRKSREIES